MNNFKGVFDQSYNDRKIRWTSSNLQQSLEINFQLMNNFKGVFDQSYNDRKIRWTSSNLQQSLESNRTELLSIHFYNPLIAERKQDRSMSETRIVQFQQKNLHSLDDYVDVLLSISRIESISRYLINNVIPVSADWPGQLFIRKAITKINY
ncbi:10559_t:CDS:2 [Entrophospora sp. SA101]|nr:10559_t:CDS:2 [Entrophospora sp. SA101]